MTTTLFVVTFCLFLLVLAAPAEAKKKEKEKDPKECEVCISNLEKIDSLLKPDEKKKKDAVRAAIGKHCTKSGFGSEWKPNPELTSPKDVKMCYIFEPIKEAITTPFITGMPKERICKKLKKDNPDVCDVKYPIKIEKKPGEEVDYSKMRVKALKSILAERGVQCTGCTEKPEFVKKCQETEHLDM